MIWSSRSLGTVFVPTRRLAQLVCGVLAASVCSGAAASTRTFCTTISFPDMRNCDNNGDGQPDPGMINPCKFGENQNAGYLIFDVYDYDPPGNEHEYIGSWFAAGYGPVCVTFEWEGAPYSLGETHPDPYVKITKWEWRTTNGKRLYLRMSDGTVPPALSWHNNYTQDCATGSACWSPGINLIQGVTNLPTSLAKIGDSAIHGLNAFKSETTDMTIRYCTADEEIAGCETKYHTNSGFYVTVGESYANQAIVPVHEFGHHLLHWLLRRSCINDYFSYCAYGELPPCGHDMDSREYDKVATNEGWADYVAARAWWDPENQSSKPAVGGYYISHDELPPTSCSSARGKERYVAAGFWDLDDATMDSGVSPAPARVDVYNYDTSAIAAPWTLIEPGPGNRYACESDYNGLNLWDYWWSASSFSLLDYSSWQVLIDMQCQYSMDYN